MRSTRIPAIAAVLMAASAGVADRAGAQSADPPVPTGSLSAFPTTVHTGTFPTLSWGITYPETVTSIVDFVPPAIVTPKRSLVMRVRVIGASVMRVWLNSQGQVLQWEWVPTEALVSVNNSSYSRIWYGTQNTVNSSSVVLTRTVHANQPIRFGARYLNSNGSWNTFFNSNNTNGNVVALKNGDTPPTPTPLYEQPSLESFLVPYLDSNGNIKIGPKDVIYLFEITHTDHSHPGFDLQDLVLLVTFSDI